MAFTVAPARAGFINGGFETGDFTGWTLEHGTANGGTVTFTPGAAGHAYVIGAVDDPYSPFDAPFNGSYMAQLNEVTANYDATRISQTATMQTGETDIYVNWGAVLQYGGHVAADQAFFSIVVRKNGTVVASDSQNAGPSQPGWTTSSSGFAYKSGQFHLGGLVAGDQVEIVMTAQDCSGGGHAGYAYLDGIGTVAPPPPTTGPGSLDSGFSGDGIEITPFYSGATKVPTSGSGIVRQSNGKLIVAGTSGTSGTKDFCLARYNTDGALDTGFGTGGKVVTSIRSTDDYTSQIIIQPDDKILVGGTATTGGGATAYDCAVARYNADGTLDNTFGTGGIKTVDFQGGNDWGDDLVLQPDGMILICGTAMNVGSGNSDLCVARLTSTGALDTGFNGTGKRMIAVSATYTDEARGMALQADGRIVLVGRKYITTTDGDSIVVRLNADGSTDTAFGTNGLTQADNGSYDLLSRVAIQPDGKLVCCGIVYPGGTYSDSVLERFTASGQLDTTFNGTGKTVISQSSGDDSLSGLLVQPDGRIVAVGSASNGTNLDMLAVRFNPDGTVDTGFSGTGKATYAPGPGNDTLSAVLLQPDGNLVACGTSSDAGGVGQMAVIRVLAQPKAGVWNLAAAQAADSSNLGISGQIDPAGLTTTVSIEYGTTAGLGSIQSVGTFSGNGLQNFSTTLYPAGLTMGTTYYYRIVANNANGTTIAAIQSFYYGPGTLDVTFSGDGMQTAAIGNGNDSCQGIVVQSDGKIVLGGYAAVGGINNFALMRFNADGTLDTHFDANAGAAAAGTGSGKVTTAIGSIDARGFRIGMQNDGKILLTGTYNSSTNEDFATARYNADGTLDSGFGTGGIVKTGVGSSHDNATAGVAVQSDGKIVVGGQSSGSPYYTFSAVRYNSAGVLDSSYGTGGKVTTPFSTGHSGGSGLALQSDGKMVMVGSANNGSYVDVAIARYTTSGILDTTFGTGGKVITPFGAASGAHNVSIQPDGKIIVAGEVLNGANGYDFMVARYNTDGSLDTTFNTTGKVTTPIGSGDEKAKGVAIQSDGRIVVAGYASNGTDNDFALVRYNADGSLDTTFHDTGKVTIPIGTHDDNGTAVAIKSNGNIVMAGSSNNGANSDFAVVRVLGFPESGPLVNGNFESAEFLGGGFATSFGDWAGDQASIVTAENGITPYAGSRMLKILGTTITGATSGTTSQTAQYVDLSNYAAALAAGPVSVTVTARVNRVAGDANTDTQFNIFLSARSGTIASGAVVGTQPLSFISDANPGTWELITNAFVLPATTTHLFVNLRATENVFNNMTAPEFDGHYIDDVQLSVRTDFTAPTLTPVSIASNNANHAWAKVGEAAAVVNTSGNTWIASSAIVGAGSPEGVAAFSIAATDLAGNTANAVTTTDSSTVTVDKTQPTLTPPANIIVGASSAAGVTVGFTPGATDNLDPAPVLVANPPSGSLFPIGVTTVNLMLTDAAGNVSTANFTVTVHDHTSAPNFADAATVPLVTNGFDATGLSVGTPTLGFDPAPGQVLTLVNNTSANPIGGSFNDLPDGGTVTTNYGGRTLLFQASYSGGDGNDITLTLLAPEIAVEQPAGTDIPNGGTRTSPTAILGNSSVISFMIRSVGPGILNGLALTKSGADQADFVFSPMSIAPLSPGDSRTFGVLFTPTTSGLKTVMIHIASDDADENPFDIILSARALSASEDTDGDGMNDVAEFSLVSLGYDWQVSQPGLVNTLFSNANAAGLFTQPQYDANRAAGRADVTGNPNAFSLYTLTQVQELNVGTPLLARDPVTGKFKLTIDLLHSGDFQSFEPMPFTQQGTTINGQGAIEFEFTPQGSPSFYRLKAR